jgi:putative phosphoesterase
MTTSGRRVAALSDIHGNLPALEAVLVDVEREGVDAIVVAGDSFSGPWPAEVVDLLLANDALIVRGNADRLDAIRDVDSALGRWNEEHLGPDRLATVKTWPLTLSLEVEELGAVLVCHATPQDDEPIHTRITPEDELEQLLGRVREDVLVCGHTHMQYDRRLAGGLRVVNPGSVGMPYEGRPGAYWAVLGPDVEFRRTEYDVVATVAAVRALGTPVREQLLDQLVDPPTSDETTRYFESLRGA